ncbi:MAG: anion transporter [Gammaproteobacteria bacterium]|nr:anion transporter [Gammaproteobacteria bacterium]
MKLHDRAHSAISPTPAYSLGRDYLLWIFVAALVVLSVLVPPKISDYFTLVDWPTIAALLGLMMIAKGVELSGGLHRAAQAIAARVVSERRLALFLVAGSGLAAMLLTNDIVLFVVVPLTLELGEYAALPLRRLVIFEALAVNAGAMLTPIGNPQNIFLWQHSGVGFGVFVAHMFVPFVIAEACLLALTAAAFPGRCVVMDQAGAKADVNRRTLVTSVLLFAPFLVLADWGYTAAALALVAGVFVFRSPRLLRRVDWPLIAVFILMFIDLGLLARYRPLAAFDLASPENVYIAGALVSQVVSNVPAAILLAARSADWTAIAWGVNVGAFGLVIASFASLIALRLGHQRGSYLAFHAWSLPFFFVVGTLTWLWI